MKQTATIVLWTTCTCLTFSNIALASTDCSSGLAMIDARLVDKPDDHNRQIISSMRQMVEQMCASMDTATLDAVLANLDVIYPETKQPPNKGAPPRASELAASVKQSKRRQVTSEAKSQRHAIFNTPPTAKSLLARHIDRKDEMHNLWVYDWDTYQGNLRILYSTHPDRSQLALPDWKFHVYVAQISPAGDVSQISVTSKQASDHSALALRRGFDELFFLRQVDRSEESMFFERWSISDKRLLTQVNKANLTFIANGKSYRSLRYAIATSDGNFMFSSVAGHPPLPLSVVWFKLSPQGDLITSGEIDGASDDLREWAWFATQNGGGGLVANIQARADKGLSTGEMATFAPTDFPASVKAIVGSEKRAYLIDGANQKTWQSIALERIMSFGPKDPTPPTTTESMQQRLVSMTDAQNIAARNYRIGRRVQYLNIGPNRHELIKPMDGGVAALLTQVANRKLRPPIHGQYLVKLDRQGVTNEIFLNSVAQQLEVRFTSFAPDTVPGQFYLFANRDKRRAYVIRHNSEGQPLAYAETADPRANFDLQHATLVADEGGVWVFGNRWQEHVGKPLLWVERLAFK